MKNGDGRIPTVPIFVTVNGDEHMIPEWVFETRCGYGTGDGYGDGDGYGYGKGYAEDIV